MRCEVSNLSIFSYFPLFPHLFCFCIVISGLLSLFLGFPADDVRDDESLTGRGLTLYEEIITLTDIVIFTKAEYQFNDENAIPERKLFRKKFHQKLTISFGEAFTKSF